MPELPVPAGLPDQDISAMPELPVPDSFQPMTDMPLPVPVWPDPELPVWPEIPVLSLIHI